MIPPFGRDGNLPPGIHAATWDEIVERFGRTSRRRELAAGLLRALLALRDAGCEFVYIDGSFVSTKENPGDFDGCWNLDEVDLRRLDPVLFDFASGRRAQKRKYGGEFYPASFTAGPDGESAIDYFQRDKVTTLPKGIVVIDVRALR